MFVISESAEELVVDNHLTVDFPSRPAPPLFQDVRLSEAPPTFNQTPATLPNVTSLPAERSVATPSSTNATNIIGTPRATTATLNSSATEEFPAIPEMTPLKIAGSTPPLHRISLATAESSSTPLRAISKPSVAPTTPTIGLSPQVVEPSTPLGAPVKIPTKNTPSPLSSFLKRLSHPSGGTAATDLLGYAFAFAMQSPQKTNSPMKITS